MFLPDKIVIDLNQIELVAGRLSNLLENIIATRDYSYIITGNDLEYSARELLSFKQKLTNLIHKESKKYQYDIFGNTIKRIDKYRYAELMFSEDYTEITSIRLLGLPNKNISGNRYVLFNLANIFEPTVLNLLFKADEILSSTQNIATDKKMRNDFLQDYFAPFPILHNINQNIDLLNAKNNKKYLDTFTKKFDDKKPKTYEELVSQNIELRSLDFKTNIYTVRKNSFSEAGDIPSLINKIEAILKDEKPEIDLSTFKLPAANIANIRDTLTQLTPYEVFVYLDRLPAIIRNSIYEISIPNIQFSLQNLLIEIELFANTEIQKINKNFNISLTNTKNKFTITQIFNNIKNKFPNIYSSILQKFNALFPKELFLEALETTIGEKQLTSYFLSLKLPDFKIPTLSVPEFNFDIADLFSSFSVNVNSAISNSLQEVLIMITKTLLELLKTQNRLEDFALENIFPLPQTQNIPTFKVSLNNDWLTYIQYVYRLLEESKNIRTAPQINRIDNIIPKNNNIRNKIISKRIPVATEACQPLVLPPKSKINNKTLKKRAINNIKDAVQKNDIDSLLEKLKVYNFSDVHDYFVEQNTDDDMVVDAMRFIANNLKEQPSQIPPILPASPKVLLDSIMSMIEQILTILDPQEINSLLEGTYTETTAEIVRNIAKINFPTLTYKVDPIKYFRMLGKVVGTKNIPTDLAMSIRNLGVTI